MYAIDLSTARLKWRQTLVTAYICQELNLIKFPLKRKGCQVVSVLIVL